MANISMWRPLMSGTLCMMETEAALVEEPAKKMSACVHCVCVCIILLIINNVKRNVKRNIALTL